jgi:hypothetical protein
MVVRRQIDHSGRTVLSGSSREETVLERLGAANEHRRMDLEQDAGCGDEREVSANRCLQEPIHTPDCCIRANSEPGLNIHTQRAAS